MRWLVGIVIFSVKGVGADAGFLFLFWSDDFLFPSRQDPLINPGAIGEIGDHTLLFSDWQLAASTEGGMLGARIHMVKPPFSIGGSLELAKAGGQALQLHPRYGYLGVGNQGLGIAAFVTRGAKEIALGAGYSSQTLSTWAWIALEEGEAPSEKEFRINTALRFRKGSYWNLIQVLVREPGSKEVAYWRGRELMWKVQHLRLWEKASLVKRGSATGVGLRVGAAWQSFVFDTSFKPQIFLDAGVSFYFSPAVAVRADAFHTGFRWTWVLPHGEIRMKGPQFKLSVDEGKLAFRASLFLTMCLYF